VTPSRTRQSGRERVAGVRVLAPARLHLGFLDLEGGLGRRFGSIGLTIEGLATRILAVRAPEMHVEGTAEIERCMSMLAKLAEAWKLGPAHVAIEETIPPHAGLGSGTQLVLALALGTAVPRLAGHASSARSIAQLLRRGSRSGIGIGAFEQGGFILDGGRGLDDAPPPVIARLAFPEVWRLLLVFDRASEGLHGAGEDSAFRRLPPYSPELAGRLCRLVLMQLLPGLANADLDAVGPAIGEIQREVGDYFAPAQSGRFTSPAVGAVLAWLQDQGVAGVGQSSWGPTGFAILPDADRAEYVCREAERRFGTGDENLRFMVTRARNRGAEISEAGWPSGRLADQGTGAIGMRSPRERPP
jgi:beta-ribofuranosylaminobenzene 5'-phosphate synthase